MPVYKKLPILIIFFLVHNIIPAQQNSKLVFTHLSMQDGLSNNNINCITQDSSGFIWIGTADGLNRYDGRHFKIYRFDPLQTNSLPNNNITGIAVDKKGLVWAGTTDGLCSINPLTDSITNYKNIPGNQGSLSNNYQPIPFIDHNNDLWVGTKTGLDYFDRKKKTFIHYHTLSAAGQMQNNVSGSIRKIIEDKQHRLWCAGFFCIFSFDPVQKEFTRYSSGREYSLYYDLLPKDDTAFYIAEWRYGLAEFNTVTKKFKPALPENISKITLSLLRCSFSGKDLLLAGTDQALVIVNQQDKSIETYKHDITDPSSLSGDRINNIFLDRQKIIWLGTQNGISLLNPQLQLFSNPGLAGSTRGESEKFGEADVIAENESGYLLAVGNYMGLYQYDKKWKLIKRITSVPPFSASSRSKSIFHILPEKKMTWFSTDSGLIKFDEVTKRYAVFLPPGENNNGHLEWQIRKIIPYEKDLFFVRTWNMGIYLFDKKTGKYIQHFSHAEKNPGSLADNNVLDLIINNRNEVYASTANGLCLYHPSSSDFTIYRPNPPAAGLSNFLGKMTDDKNGNLWITSLQGLFFFDTKTKQFTRYTTADGMANNQNNRLCMDKNNRLWITTTTGISMFDPAKKQFYNFSTREGLPSDYFEGALTSLGNGQVAAAYNGGIVIIDPDRFPFNTDVPSVNFSEIKILDKPFAWHLIQEGEKEIRLRHKQNVINISFAVLNFTSPYQNKFFYKLENFDADWRQSPDGNISYTNLSPGKYVLKIKGANNSGVMNEKGDQMQIIIAPSFLQTPLFRILAVIAIGTLVFFLVKIRISNIRRRAEVKQKIAETEMMALRAQMNPHFIFNCINSIDALIQSNDKYHATVYLNKFAKLIRNILDSSRQNTVPLTKDIETLQLYIDMEQFRNENKFRVEIKTDEALLQDDYKVPPLIVQPYVENAIQHGLRNRPDNNGKLFISIQKKDEQIHYCITDNGRGRNGNEASIFHQKEKISYGMQMSSDRIRLFNKEDKASVKITDLTENGEASGTKVEVLINIQ